MSAACLRQRTRGPAVCPLSSATHLGSSQCATATHPMQLNVAQGAACFGEPRSFKGARLPGRRASSWIGIELSFAANCCRSRRAVFQQLTCPAALVCTRSLANAGRLMSLHGCSSSCPSSAPRRTSRPASSKLFRGTARKLQPSCHEARTQGDTTRHNHQRVTDW